MPPKRSNTLTEAELRIMRILWARGESLVSDLVSAMPESSPLAYTSVLTTVRVLEQKGYVKHGDGGITAEELQRLKSAIAEAEAAAEEGES